MTVDQKKLAEITGLSMRTIYRYRKQGMPIAGRIRRGVKRPTYFNVQAVKLWMGKFGIVSRLRDFESCDNGQLFLEREQQ